MSIRKEDIDIENPLNNFKLLWNAGKENWRNKEHIARLTVFYSKHHPAKLNSISSLLSKYEGRELEMYNNIYKKYGVDALSAEDRKKLEYTYILTEYYKVHNPERLSDVAKLIKKYSDDYEKLFQKMEKKYGTDPRVEISLPLIVPTEPPKSPKSPKSPLFSLLPKSPRSQKEEEEYSYSDYSYDEQEQTDDVKVKQEAFKQAAESSSKDSNIFSSFLRSSKKLFEDLSNAGVKSDAPSRTSERAKIDRREQFGRSFVTNDSAIEQEVGKMIESSIAASVEKVDDSLSELVGVMQEEEALWKTLATEVQVDQTAIVASYQTRLNALLQRVKNIEIMLMNREEEIEHEGFAAWKEEKNRKLGMLQSIYNQQVAAKKEELEDLRQSRQSELLSNSTPSSAPNSNVAEDDDEEDDDLYSFC